MAGGSVDLCKRYRAGYGVTTAGPEGAIYLRTACIDGVERECLFLHPPNSVSFELPNRDAYLSFAIAMAPECWGERTGACTFIVAVDGETVFSDTIDVAANAAHRRWNARGVFIPASLGGGESRAITLRTESPDGLDFRWALWGRPVATVFDAGERWAESGPLAPDDDMADRIRAAEIERLLSCDCEKINLGCGGFQLDGWTNIDGGDGVLYRPPEDDRVIALDALRALRALPTGVARCISSEHFFEHFTRQDGFRLLEESLRVLRPGGVIRIHMPDLEQVVRLYLDEIPEADWERVQKPHRRVHLSLSNDPYGRLLADEQYTRAIMINNGFHMDG
ncbi:hypothetical protein LCGC14_3048750, partial [marine sediment metagenome]